ncbi:MAG: MFS transporter [Clostridium sp.]|jgi:GPH family glycoside/pentoside/hexuronide:cation symporter|nr:MFS transporter [Clostridium sp.]
MSVIDSAREGLTKLRVYWKTPPKGKYVNYKELTMYSIGGIGVQFLLVLVNAQNLAVGSMFFGNAVGIAPTDLQVLNVMVMTLAFVFAMVRSWLFDNTRGKQGKYRPWLRLMGLPTLVLSLVTLWLPYDTMSYNAKFFGVFVTFSLLQIIMPFYRDSYDGLAMVMSPDSQERSDIVSISRLVWSIAPSIYWLVLGAIGEQNNVDTYQRAYTPFLVIGFFLGIFSYRGTKERIIQGNSHFNQVRFIDSIREVSKNRNFWIIQLATWVGFLEAACATPLVWMHTYAYKPESDGLFSVLNYTLIGNAGMWAMLAAPFLMRQYGKRSLIIQTNILQIGILALLLFTYKSVPLLVLLLFIQKFVGTVQEVIVAAANADVRDQQQYISGVRIDGMFSSVGFINNIVGMATGFVLPALYAAKGLAGSNYGVLYDPSVLNATMRTLLIASVIGATANLVPFFFYDMTEKKQRGMARVLKIRAMFEDYGNGTLEDASLAEGVEIIRYAQETNGAEKKLLTKTAIQSAKQLPKGDSRTAALKGAREDYFKTRQYNEDVEIAHYVIDELHKFDSAQMQEYVRLARLTVDRGLAGLYEFDAQQLKDARALPAGTKEEKVFRSKMIRRAKDLYDAYRNVNRLYPNGMNEMDVAESEALYELPEDTKEQRAEKRAKIRFMERERAKYSRCAKPYLDAHTVVTEQENYTHLDEIFGKYEEAKARAIAAAAAEAERLEKIEEERKAEIERLKAERDAEKAAKKEGKK